MSRGKQASEGSSTDFARLSDTVEKLSEQLKAAKKASKRKEHPTVDTGKGKAKATEQNIGGYADVEAGMAGFEREMWLGKSLTDPVNTVEVGALARQERCKLKASSAGQVAAAAGLSQSQGSRQAAYRLVQPLCRRRAAGHHARQRPDPFRH